MKSCIVSVLLMVCLCALTRGQGPGFARAERMIVVVPLVGAGTMDDPRRPLGMPVRGLPPGVTEMTYVLSDDQKLAIEELTALKRSGWPRRRSR